MFHDSKNKTDMFAFTSDMNKLANYFGKEKLCELFCEEQMNNEHLPNCEYEDDNRNIPYN